MAYLVDTNVMVDFTRGNANAADCLDIAVAPLPLPKPRFHLHELGLPV